jgi:N6-L-threonylcarbamoyladenine synthase
MRILGIESSCDETAAAVVEDGFHVLSDVVRSQAELHAPFGGPVPEIASRSHLEAIMPVVDQAVREAGIPLADLDAIAVTNRPGLIGALLVGVGVAKALALALRKPLIGVDHIAAHVHAAWMDDGPAKPPALPGIALVVSGGHSVMFEMSDPFTLREIANTIDDACGETYDKVATMLGLGYPGGPVIDRLAREGNADAYPFKAPLASRDGTDFSFSGIKTAVRYRITGENKKHPPLPLDAVSRRDLAASFQRAVVDALLAATTRAVDAHGARSIVIGGGCAANSEIRARFAALAAERGLDLRLPSRARCSDNGAMIAGLGYHLLMRRGPDDLTLDAEPTS